jgi:hypothetical protein
MEWFGKYESKKTIAGTMPGNSLENKKFSCQNTD